MTGDVREATERSLLTTLSGETIRNGYVLPADFRLVTRDLKDPGDLQPGQLPACLLQVEEPQPVPMLAHIVQMTLPFRVIVQWSPDIDELPASQANAFGVAVTRAILSDPSQGGYVDETFLQQSPVDALYVKAGLLQITVRFEMLYEYDPRREAVVS